MMLKKGCKYVSYHVKNGKKTYGGTIIVTDDCEVPKEVLKNTGYEHVPWDKITEFTER
jgi:hypothetical protein